MQAHGQLLLESALCHFFGWHCKDAFRGMHVYRPFSCCPETHLRLKFISDSILMNTKTPSTIPAYMHLPLYTLTHAHTLTSHIHIHTSHRMCSTLFYSGSVWTWRSPLKCLGFFSSTCTAMNPTGCRGDTLYRYCVHARLVKNPIVIPQRVLCTLLQVWCLLHCFS